MRTAARSVVNTATASKNDTVAADFPHIRDKQKQESMWFPSPAHNQGSSSPLAKQGRARVSRDASYPFVSSLSSSFCQRGVAFVADQMIASTPIERKTNHWSVADHVVGSKELEKEPSHATEQSCRILRLVILPAHLSAIHIWLHYSMGGNTNQEIPYMSFASHWCLTPGKQYNFSETDDPAEVFWQHMIAYTWALAISTMELPES